MGEELACLEGVLHPRVILAWYSLRSGEKLLLAVVRKVHQPNKITIFVWGEEHPKHKQNRYSKQNLLIYSKVWV